MVSLISSTKIWIRTKLHYNRFAEQIVDQLIRFVEEKHEINWKQQCDKKVFQKRPEKSAGEAQLACWEDQSSDSLAMINLLFEGHHCFAIKNPNAHNKFPWGRLQLDSEECLVQAAQDFGNDFQQ